MGRKAIDLAGQRFGRLTVLERAPTPPFNANRHAWWKCRCDCGEEVQTSAHYLMIGHTRSCGCLRRETTQIIGSMNRRR